MGLKELRGIMRSEFRGEVANSLQAYKKMGMSDEDLETCLAELYNTADDEGIEKVINSNSLNRGDK